MLGFGAGFVAIVAFLGHSTFAASNNKTSSSAAVHWLGETPAFASGVTFGVPWPKGKFWPGETRFGVVGNTGHIEDLQSWTTGYWADGSLKWTGHAIGSSEVFYDKYTIVASSSAYTRNSSSSTSTGNSTSSLIVTNGSSETTVNTGKLSITFPKEGSIIVSTIKTEEGKTVAENGRLILQSQNWVPDTPENRGNASIQYSNFGSSINEVTVDHGSARALVTIRGQHKSTGGTDHDPWLHFVLRFYLYANSSSIRLLHSIVFDGEADKDFITGLGIRFDVPLKGEEQYNRHVRFAGVDGGILNEAVQGITGLRRDPGENVRTAQVEGRELPDTETWDARVTTRLKWIPTWGDYSLAQLTSDGFSLKKRTKAGQSWVKIPSGSRAEGLAYLGGATQGGLAVGLRDFWKRYPSGLDISNAASDTGEITLWLYSPAAEPLDLRPYHDGLKEDGYEDQLDALEITYEDYEPGFNTPTESHEQANDELSGLTSYINSPPVLVPEPDYIHQTKALGEYWELPVTDNDASKALESHLDFILEFYKSQIEQRRWYGFLEYGDFMHTYDTDRHTWRYDIGGYAWDNSELSPDLFFWLYFLRTGREDAYRFAEALTRHTGEVDVYHIGDWKGLGTRHGVQHWADSAKQARISQPQYRKYFFYLSGGDERIGELLEELLDTDKTLAHRMGTSWAAMAGGKTKLNNTVTGIAKLTNGFVTGSGLYNPETWTLGPPPTDPENHGNVSVSHLSAVFGLPEVVSEVISYFGNDLPDGFKDAWLDYCYYYRASAAEQIARYGASFGKQSLYQAHSRLAAYAAYETSNSSLTLRAWKDFYTGDGIAQNASWSTTLINGSAVLTAIDEVEWLATNDISQYGLAVIQNLAYISSALEEYAV
ncbi:hypothetical protein N7532_004671 [Penicillium argentinense]|uniref:Tat pathway signal sequence domain protein n=1 Tax=Penicillium argentinense TaxID=1131581 RepID=A0A9W9FPT0_9EURO|nr:uncharacterized protein N7532_004671 [Penicillium argentinense]KAJ5104142.1 hypothetical protein N7532_004671 [Penicillium argentinense]